MAKGKKESSAWAAKEWQEVRSAIDKIGHDVNQQHKVGATMLPGGKKVTVDYRAIETVIEFMVAARKDIITLLAIREKMSGMRLP